MKHIISFVEGMDKDTSFNKYPNTRYLHSENFRFIYDEENSLGILTNDVGDTHRIAVDTSETILGHTVIRDVLILFTYSDTLTHIYKIPINDMSLDIQDYKVFSKDFGNNESTVIKAIGKHESEDIEKLYWTDGISFKFCNLLDPNITVQNINRFEAYPENSLAIVKVLDTTTGSLKAGKVQYAYQLYNVNGAATNINGLSRLVNITTSSEGHSRLFKGDLPGKDTSKGCRVEVSGIDLNFDRIRLYRLFYTDISQVPEVYLVDEVAVTNDTIVFEDVTAFGMRQVAYEEVIAMSADLLFETLETKNNILFVGNVTEKIFDENIGISVMPEGLGGFGISTLTINVKGLTPRTMEEEDLVGAEVKLTFSEFNFTDYTDQNGIVVFNNIPRVDYNLQVTYDGYNTYTNNIDLNTTSSRTVYLSGTPTGGNRLDL